MYVTCSLGHRHWGTAGAAGGLVVAQGASGTQVLLTLRSAEVHQGNTWSIPGGAIDAADADPHAAACREIEEELGFDVSAMPVIGWHSFECGGWTYTTVLLITAATVPLTAHGWETEDVVWFDVGEVDRLAAGEALHPSFAASWPALRRLVTTSRATGLEATPSAG